VNTLFPQKLAELARIYRYNLIHITTDCVYSGKDGNYDEKSLHDSETIYGITKSLGEPENFSTTIRTSIIGEEITSKKSFLEWVLSNRGKECNGYVNHFWNGVTCLTVAKIIKKMIDEGKYWYGARHIFSPSIVSKYELCKIINETYNADVTILPVIAEEEKLMSLSGDCEEFDIPPIRKQVEEQREFNILGSNVL
jgi:dTDP-4-dehydrorhamnose reductase